MITLLLMLAIFGFLVYLIVNYIPMPPVFRTGIIVIAVVLVILYLIQVFGIGDLPIPRIHH